MYRCRIVDSRTHPCLVQPFQDSVAVGDPDPPVDDRRIEDVCEWRGFALVSDLEVMPLHRRLGAGRALMEALEAEALGAGMPGVALDTGTEESFAEARGLYRSMSYIDRGEVFLGGWSDPLVPGHHFVDPLTQWFKRF